MEAGSEEADASLDLLQQNEMLELALKEEEQKVMQAALFGKQLLDKTRELEEVTATLRQENALLQQHGEAERAELQTKVDRMERQLQDASNANERLLEEVTQRTDELARAQTSLKGGVAQNEELATLRAENDALKANSSKMKSEEKSATLAAMQASRVWEDERTQMRKELESMRASAASAGQEASKRATASEQLGGVAAELEEMKHRNGDLLAEKRSMEEAVTSLVRQTQELQHENEEQMAFLEQARDTIAALRTERDAAVAGGGGGGGVSTGGSSLLDELEANMNSKIQQKEAKPQRLDAGDGAPENCEEYFLIAQTAVKIGLAMKYPHKSDEVFKVRGIDLYYKCLNSHVPFHQWHLWISRTLHSMLKGDVKPAALMESSKKSGDGGDNGNNRPPPPNSSPKKGWLDKLFN